VKRCLIGATSIINVSYSRCDVMTTYPRLDHDKNTSEVSVSNEVDQSDTIIASNRRN
jgi:hypothetical protein